MIPLSLPIVFVSALRGKLSVAQAESLPYEKDIRPIFGARYFDLVGLPPSSGEVQQCNDDPKNGWYDRLLTDKVHLHDLHATILHVMGLDHEFLTYFHQGRDESLTDVGGQVIHDLLA